tara:strand:- start:90 stop:470 length:381 start_codon:yes stop_codon:yes gene_type:complete
MFDKKFKKILTEDITDSDAAAGVMDNPDTMGQLQQDVQASPAIAHHHQVLTQHQNQVRNWINQLEAFVTYLNGLDGDSIQATLNNADCDTLLSDIARGETKKISRAAQDLSRLVESLKGYLLSAED